MKPRGDKDLFRNDKYTVQGGENKIKLEWSGGIEKKLKWTSQEK